MINVADMRLIAQRKSLKSDFPGKHQVWKKKYEDLFGLEAWYANLVFN